MPVETRTRHLIERIRQEPKRRTLTVTAVRDITPRMRRIAFTSPDLSDFSSPAPDDHIKLLFPDPQAPDGTSMRDYTPRGFDPAGLSLTIDFALHETGLATSWARAAVVGDRLTIAGPKGSVVLPDDFDHYLLVGDETALPAIGRRLETLRPDVPVTAVMVVEDAGEVQRFPTAARLDPVWVFRNGVAGEDEALLRRALAAWRAPGGDGYVWIAAEARVARGLKTYMLEERGHPRAWLKASGYWLSGEAGAHDKLEG